MLQAIKSQHDVADLVSFPDEFAGVNEEEKKYLVYFIHNIILLYELITLFANENIYSSPSSPPYPLFIAI